MVVQRRFQFLPAAPVDEMNTCRGKIVINWLRERKFYRHSLRDMLTETLTEIENAKKRDGKAYPPDWQRIVSWQRGR